jgi:hypothetical protein
MPAPVGGGDARAHLGSVAGGTNHEAPMNPTWALVRDLLTGRVATA